MKKFIKYLIGYLVVYGMFALILLKILLKLGVVEF